MRVDGSDIGEALSAIVDADRLLKHAGVPSSLRLHPLGDQSGLYVYAQALAVRATLIVEVGSSYGYSAVWLAAAAKHCGGRLISYEVEAERSRKAQDVLAQFGLGAWSEFVVADAREALPDLPSPPQFVLLDGAKEEYPQYLDAILTVIGPSDRCVIVADNMISHRSELHQFVDRLDTDPRIIHALVPIGKGLELCIVNCESDG